MKNRPTLLILDDNAEILQVLQNALSDRYDVFIARDTSHAVTLLSTRRYDLFITDLSMPLLNGVEFIRLLRRDSRFDQMSILVISGFPELTERLEDNLVAGILQKPFDVTELLGQIEDILRGSQGPL